MEIPYTLHTGDCREVMATFAPESIDAIVTDPPYGLSFMGREWDHDVPGVPFWAEALRVAKPGAHLLAFGGSRTLHRLTCAVEDAGWEIRDVLMWLYGTGFPKSLDVSKAIDKAAGAERGRYPRAAFGGTFSDDGGTTYGTAISNAPATDAARQWSGWGTALKPAYEPVILARKPLRGTVAANVLAHGTGVLNVDGCRIGTTKNAPSSAAKDRTNVAKGAERGRTTSTSGFDPNVGRWPANVLLDDAAAAVLDGQSGESASSSRPRAARAETMGYGGASRDFTTGGFDDRGGASRFFYTSKASAEDRGRWAGNDHPTVKPTDVMRWLCRLITPPGGLILDPFMGSGSTGVAAVEEGFRFVGIDLDPRHVDIAERRLRHAARQPSLFG